MDLKKLSNEELLSSTKKLVGEERELLLDILNHLKEIDSRRLYLEIGYASLWAYCTGRAPTGLQYSEASAQRRIEAMRALRDIPILAEKIESGALSLSNIARAQSVLRKAQSFNTFAREDKAEIFLELENKCQKEAEAILATHFPQAVQRLESIRPINADVSEVKLSISTEILEKINRVKELMSHKNPNPSLAETLEMMADFVISKKDPLANRERAKKKSPPQRRLNISTRYIGATIRRNVWQAARGVCEYTEAKSGHRCGSRHQLEVEHVKPMAFGGGNEIENLKLFCRAHNQHSARQATLM